MPEPTRILVFQTAYLGDVVLATPLLEALKRRFPDAALDIVVQPAWSAIVETHPAVRRVIAYDKRGSESGLMGTLHFAGKLSREHYDIVFCPHPSFRSALILKLAGIPQRVGFNDSSGHFFFTRNVVRDKSLHEVRRVLSLLNNFGEGNEEDLKPRVHLPKDFDVDGLFARLGIPTNARLAGIHPGSVWATKRWMPERFGETARALTSDYERVLIFGTAKEKGLAAEVALVAGPSAADLSGALSLTELGAVISRLSLFVTNDSGPMHIASAFNIPTVAVFGSTVTGFGYAPFHDKSRVVEIALPCRPCGPHGYATCPLKHFRCMRDVTVESVLAACRQISRPLE